MPNKPRNILPSKLSVPTPSPFQLERSQLGERIGTAGHVRVIVLRAPAAFSKPPAMLQHAARLASAGRATAWLNLDGADDDLGRFLVHLEAAIERVAPSLPPGQSDGGVLELIGRVAASSADFTLFLDDFESIQSSAVLDLLRELLDHMPPSWQVVIGSRTVPSLGLGRLRAHGKVLEIGLEQLRFSAEETSDFLREQRGLQLSAGLLARLHAATEGWVTALWLASV